MSEVLVPIEPLEELPKVTLIGEDSNAFNIIGRC